MSSAQEYEIPVVSIPPKVPLSAAGLSDRYEHYVPSTDSQHDYQILDHISQSSSSSSSSHGDTWQGGGGEGGDQNHIYHTLERDPPDEEGSSTGHGSSRRREENREANTYQSLESRTKVETHHYQASDTSRGRHGEGPSDVGYASVDTMNADAANGGGGRGQSSNRRDPAIPMQFLPSNRERSSHVNDSVATAKYDQDSAKNQRKLKTLMVVSGVLVLLVAVSISIASLVLVLTKSSSCSCQSTEDLQAQLLDVYRSIEEANSEIENLSNQLDAVRRTAESNALVVEKNEEEINAQAEILDRVVRNATMVNTTLHRNVSAILEEVGNLYHFVEVFPSLRNCSTRVEETCALEQGECQAQVSHQVPGKVTVNFDCLITGMFPNIDPSLTATTIFNEEENVVACQCTDQRQRLLENTEGECGIRVTRCSVP